MEIDKLILQGKWKIAKKIFKNKQTKNIAKLEDSHYLILRLIIETNKTTIRLDTGINGTE